MADYSLSQAIIPSLALVIRGSSELTHEVDYGWNRYIISDIALGSAHTNPQIMRTPGGHWLLFSQATCANNQYEHVCTGCHKGHCGPQPCDRPSRFPPLPPGNLSLSRRERPKMLFDKNGTPTHLFNSADPGGAATPLNPGWQHNSRPFTIVTEIIAS